MRRTIILAALMSVLIASLFASETIIYADFLSNNNEYSLAISEYYSFLFHEAHSFNDSTYALNSIARCLFENNELERLIRFYSRISNPFRNVEITSLLCMSYILNSYPDIAYLMTEDAKKPELRLLSGISLLYLNRDQSALMTFKEYREHHNGNIASSAQELIKIAENTSYIKQKSPTIAGFLSVVPGLGYAYTGSFQTAVSSLVMNSLFFASAYELHSNGLSINSGVISIIGAGFYVGNIYGSVTSAKKYNRKERISYLQQTHHVYYPLLDLR